MVEEMRRHTTDPVVLAEIKDEAVQRFLSEGMAQGIELGREEGRAEGTAENRAGGASDGHEPG